jgi:hypothetical protein
MLLELRPLSRLSVVCHSRVPLDSVAGLTLPPIAREGQVVAKLTWAHLP